MKLEVVNADAALEGLTLDLEVTGDGIYLCSNTGYTFFDPWDEINAISKSKETEFYHMHLCTPDIGCKLTGIQEVRLVE